MDDKKDIVEIEKVDDDINNKAEEIQDNKIDSSNNKETTKDKKGLAIAAMVLGIVAIVLCLIWYISIPCGILAIIFGAISLKSTNKGMALSGVITGIVGIILSIVIIAIILISAISIFNQAINSKYYDDIYDDWSYDRYY